MQLWFFYLQPGSKHKAQLNKTLVSPLQTGHYSPGLSELYLMMQILRRSVD